MASIMVCTETAAAASKASSVQPGNGRATLLTGAGGYLGRLLAASLARSGDDLVLVDRLFPPAYEPPPGRHIVGRLDVAVPEALETLVNDLDRPLTHVVHAAAVTARPEQLGMTTLDYIADHVQGAMAALHLAQAHGTRVLMLSSAAVFGAGQRGSIDEIRIPDGVGPYAIAKRIAELATVEACDGRLDGVVVRLGNLYGGGERTGPARPNTSWVQQTIDAALGGRTIRVDEPGAVQDWTYAPDVADAIAAVLGSSLPEDRVLHLSSGEALSRWSIANLVAELVPGTRVERANGPHPPRRGVLVSTRFQPSSGWTSFRDGVVEALRSTRRANPA